ncbi:MAG: phosphoribosylglycinamide formyltransferase [Alphaproteobacteria bacterium]|jgi:phosphoribosylglycinamide formyltransferase-1
MRLAVLISGRGSNLQALIDACAQDEFPASVVLVVSNNPDAQGLARAEAAGIPTATVERRDYDSRDAFDEALSQTISAHDADLVCLAGFMSILGKKFVSRRHGRLINIHPSLLPAYPGLDTHARALADGVSTAGCTVHFVTAEIDAGPIIIQETVPVEPNDTAETLAARVLTTEHRIYPQAVRLIAEERSRSSTGREVPG